MSQQLLNAVTKSYMKNDLPEFRAGDTVKVHVRIKEGDKERIQVSLNGFLFSTKLN